MGHQFPRPVVAAAVVVALAGCGGSDGDGTPPPVLDVARDQVVDASGVEPEGPDPAATNASYPTELPPPDPSSFTGAHRVVNLFAGAVGSTGPDAIDVWARRTFSRGPVLLAEAVGFGEATGFFAAPAGHRLVIVSAGAGPDGDERASLPVAADGERLTTVFADGSGAAGATVAHFHRSGSVAGPLPPGAGSGLVVLAAPNLPAFGDRLAASVGSDEFFVGDGSGSCRAQRIEATGAAARILGGSDRVVLETTPGPASISLHPAPSPDGCDQPPAIEVTVDVADGETSTVLVYTADGSSLDTLILEG